MASVGSDDLVVLLDSRVHTDRNGFLVTRQQKVFFFGWGEHGQLFFRRGSVQDTAGRARMKRTVTWNTYLSNRKMAETTNEFLERDPN